MNKHQIKSEGIASIIALIFLAIFATLAIAGASLTHNSLRQAENQVHVHQARLQAESGLGFMLQNLQAVQLPSSTTEQTLLANLRQCLADEFEGTGNLGEGTVTNTGQAVIMPAISYGDGSFSCQFAPSGAGRCRLTVTGCAQGVSRSVSMDLVLTDDSSSVFGYGIASRGRIGVWGSCVVEGANEPDEAKMLSILDETGSIELQGSVEIGGELFLSDDDATVEIQGNSATVAGTTGKSAILDNHVNHVEEPEFPEVETESFADLATNVLDSSSNYNNATYDNILIKAGTDPQFGNNVELNGIVYIEAPNKVTFKSDCVINGMVVTEDGSDETFEDCQLIFKSKVSSPGVEALPDLPEFAAVKQYTGSFVLAPGFGIEFHGQVNTINGVIAADKIDFWGHASLTIKGFVLGMTERDMTLHGHNTITIDTQNANQAPAGLVLPKKLVPDPDSYTEQ